MAHDQPYHSGPNGEMRSSNIMSNNELPAFLPPPHSNDISPSTNGMARTTSKRRRPSGSGIPIRATRDANSQPPAPEVPQPPPGSYRPTYSIDNHALQRLSFPSPSFAERAQALTGHSIPIEHPKLTAEPIQQPVKPVRRGSLNRPIGGLYSEIQQHKRDSYPPPSDSTSSRRFSNPSSPAQFQAPTPPRPPIQDVGTAKNQQLYNPYTQSPSIPQANTRRVSASSTQGYKKEWASDRSPLQKLEVKLGDISKEEKRARVQEAEQRLRDSQGDDKRRNTLRQDAHMDRSSSKRTSTAPREPEARGSHKPSDRVQKLQQQQNAYDTLSKPSRAQSTGSSPVSVSDRRHEIRSEQSSAKVPGSNALPPTKSLDRDRSRDEHAKIPGKAHMEAQPERGVRFRGADGTEAQDGSAVQSYAIDARSNRRSLGKEAPTRTNQARSTPRDSLHERTPDVASASTSEKVPAQQKDLYRGKADSSRNDASAATFGGMEDPIRRQDVRGHRKAPKYEIPPQTASGIEARQAVNFSSERQAAVIDTPAHRKHHLSDFLHRGHDDNASLEQPYVAPRRLDEWKRAGTARLTPADFMVDNSADKDQRPWWEGGRSGSRSKAARANRKDVDSLEGGYENNTSKSLAGFGFRSVRRKEQEIKTPNIRDIHTRPYLKEHEIERLKAASKPSSGPILGHFLRRSEHNHTDDLSSVYSYSCPDLALHDPSHVNHICEPYLSTELTQSMRSIRVRPAPDLATFSPPLYLKCGPLLRYTGLKRDRRQMKARSGGQSSIERETWRGSVMIVTADADSSYDPSPNLNLFYEPMDILPPASRQAGKTSNQDIPSEYIDPVAGLPKLSRSGKTVYVKPVDDLEPGKDLSQLEDDDGLFEETRTAAVPTAYGTPDFHVTSGNPKFVRREGRTVRKGQRVKGIRLHAERGVTFWRFNLEVELGNEQMRIAYSINDSPSVGFWVPARGQTMNVMFHSCNGFSMSVNPDEYAGPDPMWRDVLNSHQTRPFHVMIGGGDQIYNDAIMKQSPMFRDWLDIKNLHHKHEAEFTPSLKEELETFYLERYAMWFSQGLFGMANSQIPMINMWDDHDIIDGFGSYPHHFMSTPVFSGLGAVAYKYYMLFQHQSVSDESSADEPSWLMGAAPGPYINELSRSIFVSLGKNVALLAVDCRTERMREEILSEASYDLIFDRCRREILEGETKHLIVLLGIPIAYPRLVWLENLLTSRVMDPVKYLGRAGMLGGFLNKFDGGVEILDDLDDHWTAKNHKMERNWFVQELQELAAEKSIRVTILGGDVHLAAIGQFYSNPKLRIPKDKDHRYMANVISSAIVNKPPPNNMADILNRRDKTHHLDQDTDEDMIPIFNHDVDGSSRNNKRLLPRRNWCSIREYHPGHTPPSTPPPASDLDSDSDESPAPPTKLQRTLSLTRNDVKPGNLLRRLSGRGLPPSDGYPPGNRYNSGDSPSPESPQNDGYFPRQPAKLERAATINDTPSKRYSSAPLPTGSAPIPRPGNFHRLPTNISEKALTRGDLDHASNHINLEHGLDVAINCEVNQKDPAGMTVPYRLLIPALFYQGQGDENLAPLRKKSLVSRLTSMRGRRTSNLASAQGQGNYGQEESITSSESEGEEPSSQPRPRRWSFGITQRRQYRDQTPPLEKQIGEEGTQKGRQFEHRSQQIGQTSQQPYNAPTVHQSRYSDPETPTEQYKPARGDSIDYHQHLDSSPSEGGDGAPGRRLSKVDRMFGVANLQRSLSMNKESRIQRRNSEGAGKSTFNKTRPNADGAADGSYGDRSEDENYEEDEDPRDTNRVSRGYSGIEAYREKKGWRKWLDKAKEWEEKSRGGPGHT